MLTESLAALSEAKAALAAFAKEAPALDTNYSADDVFEVEAGKSTDIVTDAKTAYDAVAAHTSFTSVVTGFKDKKADIQDSYIASKKASLQSAVDKAAIELPSSITTLLEKMETKKEELVEALKADTAANNTLNIEITAFNFANTGVTYATDVVFASKYDASADNSTKIIISDGKAYKGQDGRSEAVLLTSLVEDKTIGRVAQIEAAYKANAATEAAVESKTTALENAVKDVILAENSQDAILGGASSLTGSVITVTATAGSEAVSIDLDNATVKVYDSADDVQEVTQVKVGALGATETYIFDGVTITATDAATAAEVAAVIGGAVDSNLAVSGSLTSTTVSVSGTTATYTATDTGTATDLVVTGTGAAAFKATVTTQGKGDASVPLSKAAPLAKILAKAIEDQDDFNILVEDFIAARELHLSAQELNDAIIAATKAITNDADAVEDAGLGLTLVDLAGNLTASSSDAEIFLFDIEKTANLTGFANDDKIFVGTDFTLVNTKSGSKISDSLGDLSILEAIVIDDGKDTNIYFEKETFGGNSIGTADLVQVTLNGVTGQEVSIDANGFLTIA